MTARHRRAPHATRPQSRSVLLGLLTLTLCAAAPIHAQRPTGSDSPARTVVATLVNRIDGTAVVSAEILNEATGHRTRSDGAGRIAVIARPGDTLRVRALGFRVRRIGAVADSRIVLEPLAATLAAVVTTAGQREISVNESAASVTVLDRRDIAAAGAVSANQLLRQLPGLQEIGSPPSQTSIAIRGLDASRVLVLVDGEPVAGSLIDNRDIGRLSTMAAERIEVTKGPSSVEFGSDALGGVINLVTAAPSQTLRAEVQARAGGLGRRESAVEVSDSYGPVGVRLNGGWRQTDRVTAVNASGSTLDRVYDFRSDVRIRASDRVSLRADLQLSQQRQRWPVGGGFNGFIDNHSVQGFVEAQSRFGGGSLRARVFRQQYAYQFRQAQALIPIAGTADSLEQDEHLTRALLAYSRALGAHALDAGVQWSDRAITAPGKVDGNRAADRVTELFVRDAWSLNAVRLTLGARSTTSSLWGSTVAPSVGGVLQPSSAWRVHGNLARGFRAPGFKELRYTFLNGNGGYTIVGNPNLTPESSWSSALGVTWAPIRALSVEVEAFRNAVSNLIDTRNTGTNAAGLLIYQNINVARARTEGIETSLHVRHALTDATLGYTLLSARDLETGRTLEGRARHTARATLAQEWRSFMGAMSDITARYTGAAPLGAGTQAALLSVDAMVRLPLWHSMEVSVGGTNLLDARPTGWTPAFQRQFTVGVTMRMIGANR